jgi:arginase
MTLALQPFSHSVPESTLPGQGRGVSILGVPMAFGCGTLGAELGPAALRVAQLPDRIKALGYDVDDLGDVKIPRGTNRTQPLRYLDEIRETSEAVAASVRDTLAANRFPIVLGGDHSVAIGTMSGVSSYFRGRGESVGLIWFDAHADMNTPDTSPSGNIHGMPLSALLGHGHADLTGLGGFSPKFDPAYCAHIGARDLDPGERALIRQLGIRFFTMREIDERGMATCVREAITIASRARGGYAVTFDVDALDPVVAPGSGTLVRGGLSYREAHLALEIIAESERMVALEVTEINTVLDVNNRTAELGVELILSALGKTIL